MTGKEELLAKNNQYIINTYGERSLLLTRGEGAYVWDIDGERYLDFLSGIGVNDLGHCHPAIVKAVQEQVAKLIHCSNLYYIEPQILLAEKLCAMSFADKAFFCNSGAEANETAIKLARRYSHKKFGEGRFGIIAMSNSFHGRTMATLTATGQTRYHDGFGPLLSGFTYAEFGDLDSVNEAITSQTCAIIMEPVQGEGGVVLSTQQFIEGVRDLCDRNDLLLIFDEVQCGLGRCGKNFAYECYGVEPDIVTLAKGLGGGLPIGAMLCTDNASTGFDPGTHASTFGGNPLVTAAANAFIDTLVSESLAQRSQEMGDYIKASLSEGLKDVEIVKEIRGLGLIIGVELTISGADIVKNCQKNGLLANCAATYVVRILPPYIVTKEQCDVAVSVIVDAIKRGG